VYTERRQTAAARSRGVHRARAEFPPTSSADSPVVSRTREFAARRVAVIALPDAVSWNNRLRPQPLKREARPAAASKIGRKTLAATKAVSGFAASSRAAKIVASRAVLLRRVGPVRALASRRHPGVSPALAAFQRSALRGSLAQRGARAKAPPHGGIAPRRAALVMAALAASPGVGPRARPAAAESPPPRHWRSSTKSNSRAAQPGRLRVASASARTTATSAIASRVACACRAARLACRWPRAASSRCTPRIPFCRARRSARPAGQCRRALPYNPKRRKAENAKR